MNAGLRASQESATTSASCLRARIPGQSGHWTTSSIASRFRPGCLRLGHGRHRWVRLHRRHRGERAIHSRGRRPRLAWLGLELDPEANAEGATRISRTGSRVACYVIPTDEELMIARHTLRVMYAHNAAMLEEKRA